ASKEDWENGRKPAHTVSIKVSDSEESQKENWMWADSLKATAGESDFCAGCHSVAQIQGQGDYVFTHGDFLESLK
nr:hypothetical protein [Granulosicoccus sp.]